MSETLDRIKTFVAYTKLLKGDEKGEAQVFCDRLFQGFGHGGYKEAGATLEYRVKHEGGTHFADLLWRPRVLIEMKRRGEKLHKHYRQAFEYWIHLVPDRPRYVVLCNFDELWVYDFNVQLDEPLDRIPIEQLADRYTAINFLFPDDPKPQFNNDRVAVTREAADKVAQVFNSLIDRKQDRETAQRFILQCVIAMFSEDFDLLPKGLFLDLIDDCRNGQSAFDLIGGLFRQMNNPHPAKGGRFKGVNYFNGGIFSTVEPVELIDEELDLLFDSASEKWSKVAPPIFGTLFQSSMGKEKRHALGAHFTHEADIQKVILPTIVRPWRERIAATTTLKDLLALGEELLKFRILDPACGSGNFLYVAYREMVNLEMEILAKIHDNFADRARKAVGTASLVSTKQFFGMDIDPFAVELAKVTLMLSKRIALVETHDNWFASRKDLPFDFEAALPLDNLDKNIVRADALFDKWEKVDAIIGNPPYQSKNKMQKEYGPAYLNRVRGRYPDVPGRADYCVYWFRRAHDELPENGRAGLVGTNTIRQNYSRQGGLDYIVENGGQITEAVSTQVWSGDAVVHVSIVNWLKGKTKGKKKLYTQVGDQVNSPWTVIDVDEIAPSLSASFAVTEAVTLNVNQAGACYQGQTHGHDGFLMEAAAAKTLLAKYPEYKEVLLPFLIARELLTIPSRLPERYVIDFHPRDLFQSQHYSELFKQVKETVLPTRRAAAEEEQARNEEALKENANAKVNRHHANFLKRWWLLSYAREELIAKLTRLPRYVVCSQVAKRSIFEFVSKKIRPNAALIVFPFADDYTFGILQSSAHWEWLKVRCSTLKGDYRYTSNTVFDTFPWPQSPTVADVNAVATAAVELRCLRNSLIKENDVSLRDLYRTLDLPGASPLKSAHEKLDSAVRKAYGFGRSAKLLEGLMKLNQEVADRETHLKTVVGPGIPPKYPKPKELITDDCVKP
jgi:hypothetical protein